MIKRKKLFRAMSLIISTLCGVGTGEAAESISHQRQELSLAHKSWRVDDPNLLSYTFEGLESLELEKGDICPQDLEELIKFLGRHPLIHTLNLSHNVLMTGMMQESNFYMLGSQLCRNTQLKSLKMVNTGISDYVVEKICWPLRTSPAFPLQVLDLSENNLGPRIGQALGEALKSNKTLKELYLNNVNIEDKGAISLVRNNLNTTLEVLSLSYNQIGCGGAIEIANALFTEYLALRVLILDHNNIKVNGLNGLLFGSAAGSSLKVLNLENNKIRFEEVDFAENGIFSDFEKLSKDLDIRLSANPLAKDEEGREKALKRLKEALDNRQKS